PIVVAEIAGNDIASGRWIIEQLTDPLIGPRSSGIKGVIDSAISVKTQYITFLLAIETGKRTIYHEFAGIRAGGNQTAPGFAVTSIPTLARSPVEAVRAVQAAVRVQPRKLPDFHAVHDH